MASWSAIIRVSKFDTHVTRYSYSIQRSRRKGEGGGGGGGGGGEVIMKTEGDGEEGG